MTGKLSRAEKRKSRQAQKKEAQKISNRIFSSNLVPETNGPPRLDSKPDLNNQPRLSPDNFDYTKYAFEWDLSASDCDGEWSWGETRAWSEEDKINIIEVNLKKQENNTWQQVKDQTYNGANNKRWRRNKYIPVCNLVQEAQDRWMLDDIRIEYPTTFRLRTMSKRRIWGFRIKSCFFVVWYDKGHEICPSKSR